MGEQTSSPTLAVSSAPAAARPAASPDEMLGTAVAAMQQDRRRLAAQLETLPVPVYVTDGDGVVRHFNRACVDFAGRTPIAGEDRWCVSWRLYDEDGTYMPHDCCPMAVAIKQKRPVRGVAVAERPDGSRVMFLPYATPIFDDAGVLVGAVNMLIDVTDRRQADALRAQAQRCRRLAQSIMDQRTVDTLLLMATEYEEKAGVTAA